MSLEDIMLNGNRPVSKGQIPCDSIYMKYLKYSNSETESGMLITGTREE